MLVKKGLKLFGAFTNIVLESRVGPDKYDDFVKEYAIKTGISCKENNAFITRLGGWDNALDAKIYFNAPKWVIESLKKLGINVLEGKKHQMRYASQYESTKENPCQYSISNNWMFWWLVDYGYRLGENVAISYNYYLMKQHIKAMSFEPLFDIRHKESENVIVEAQMFAA